MYKATLLLKIPISLKQITKLFYDINSYRLHELYQNNDDIEINIDDSSSFVNKNRIHYSDFIFAAINLSKELDEERIKLLFDQLDKDNDNYISP